VFSGEEDPRNACVATSAIATGIHASLMALAMAIPRRVWIGGEHPTGANQCAVVQATYEGAMERGSCPVGRFCGCLRTPRGGALSRQ